MQTKTILMYGFAPPPCTAPPPSPPLLKSKLLIQTASRMPPAAVISMKRANRLSTFPILPWAWDPTIALPILGVILLPTATTPCIPRFIIPGVIKKAPPLPIKPLSTPPMNPIITICSAAENDISINICPRGPCIASLLSSFRHRRDLSELQYLQDESRGAPIEIGCQGYHHCYSQYSQYSPLCPGRSRKELHDLLLMGEDQSEDDRGTKKGGRYADQVALAGKKLLLEFISYNHRDLHLFPEKGGRIPCQSCLYRGGFGREHLP